MRASALKPLHSLIALHSAWWAHRVRVTPARPNQAYGIMRSTFGVSASETSTVPPRWRLVFFSFDVKMWRIFVCPRSTFPVEVFLKRLAAPLCVFSLGMDILKIARRATSASIYGDSGRRPAMTAPAFRVNSDPRAFGWISNGRIKVAPHSTKPDWPGVPVAAVIPDPFEGYAKIFHPISRVATTILIVYWALKSERFSGCPNAVYCAIMCSGCEPSRKPQPCIGRKSLAP